MEPSGGKRKLLKSMKPTSANGIYHQGKNQRATELCLQTIPDVGVKDGHRQAKILKAFIVDDCSKAALTNKTQQHVKPDTNVDSDGWHGYCNLADMEDNHGVVNKKKICS